MVNLVHLHIRMTRGMPLALKQTTFHTWIVTYTYQTLAVLKHISLTVIIQILRMIQFNVISRIYINVSQNLILFHIRISFSYTAPNLHGLPNISQTGVRSSQFRKVCNNSKKKQPCTYLATLGATFIRSQSSPRYVHNSRKNLPSLGEQAFTFSHIVILMQHKI